MPNWYKNNRVKGYQTAGRRYWLNGESLIAPGYRSRAFTSTMANPGSLVYRSRSNYLPKDGYLEATGYDQQAANAIQNLFRVRKLQKELDRRIRLKRLRNEARTRAAGGSFYKKFQFYNKYIK